jgi:nicotinamidase-related amidase
VQPDHTALLVIDMQNDFLAFGGATDRQGESLGEGRAILPALQALLESARDANVLVIFVQMTMDPDFRLAGDVDYLRWHTRWGNLPALLQGTWGHAILDELTPRPGDLVVEKSCSSAFVGTSLDQTLRKNGIRSVVVTGVVTQGCVTATAKDALHNNYYITVVEDCVASRQKDLHEAALLLLRHSQLDETVVQSARLLAEWRRVSSKGQPKTPSGQATT